MSTTKKDAIVIAIEEGASIKELTNLYVDYVLEKMRNNKVHAARVLGINRRTIQRLIRRGHVPSNCYSDASTKQV